jgi:hypothetical protein
MTDYYPVLARAVARLILTIWSRPVSVGLYRTRVEANSQLGYEKSRATLLHRLHAVRKQHGSKKPTSATGADFASLLRWPALACLRR